MTDTWAFFSIVAFQLMSVDIGEVNLPGSWYQRSKVVAFRIIPQGGGARYSPRYLSGQCSGYLTTQESVSYPQP